MKKILTLFVAVGLLTLSASCSDDNNNNNNVDYDTIPQAFEIKNVNLGRVADNEYNLKSTFQFEVGGNLYDDETVLIYRMTDVINSNTPVWQLIPRTIYLNDGNELDYDFDFSKNDFIISARGTYNLASTPNYILGQTFRVVIIPSNLAASVNKNNYLDVMKTLKLNENQIKEVQL